jgi:hypothetical protein
LALKKWEELLTQDTRSFSLLPGIPIVACSGVSIGEDAH